MILSLVLGVLLVMVLFSKALDFSSSLAVSASSSGSESHGLQENILENNHSKNKIAIIEVDGVITSAPSERSGVDLVRSVKRQLLMAADDDEVKAVILRVDSPGGEVLASDEVYRLIKDFQETNEKPIIASMGNLAASGGYYISAPCRWIVANELTLTGSIGVIMPSYNYRGLMDKIGVRPEVYKSGKFKDMLSGSKRDDEILPEERQMVQSLIDETFAKFKSIVAEGRTGANKLNKSEGRKLADNWQEFADGRVLSGKQALNLGFVDELGNFDTAVKRARSLAGIHDANLVHYEQPFEFSNIFRMFGKTSAPAIKIDLGMEVPRLQAGRLYFLSPTVMH